MTGHPRGRTAVRLLAAAVALAAPAALLTGCSEKYAAERDGKALGEAVCDLSEAESAEEVSDATDDIASEIRNIAESYASATGEDRGAIEDTVSGLVEDVESGDLTAVQEDLAAIDQQAESVASGAADVGQAAWDGLRQGLSNCIG